MIIVFIEFMRIQKKKKKTQKAKIKYKIVIHTVAICYLVRSLIHNMHTYSISSCCAVCSVHCAVCSVHCAVIIVIQRKLNGAQLLHLMYTHTHSPTHSLSTIIRIMNSAVCFDSVCHHALIIIIHGKKTKHKQTHNATTLCTSVQFAAKMCNNNFSNNELYAGAIYQSLDSRFWNVRTPIRVSFFIQNVVTRIHEQNEQKVQNEKQNKKK